MRLSALAVVLTLVSLVGAGCQPLTPATVDTRPTRITPPARPIPVAPPAPLPNAPKTQPVRPVRPCPGPNCPRPNQPVYEQPAPTLHSSATAVGELALGGAVGPAGQEVACDLPVSLRAKNVGGKDRAGLCVFTSVMHAARYQNEQKLWDFQKQMTAELGGGWPEKLDRMIAKYGPGTPYVQHTGGDPAFLWASIDSGRPVSTTWSGQGDGHYNILIYHMVTTVHIDPPTASPRWYSILDNNYIGEDQLVWATETDYLKRWRAANGGWGVTLLAPPPPPAPRNFDPAKPRTARAPGGSSCRPVRPLADPTGYRWSMIPGSPQQHALYRANLQIGTFSASSGLFLPLTGDAWGQCQPAPVSTPAPMNFGVDFTQPAPVGSTYTLNGQPVSREVALKAIGDGIPADKNSLRVTAIGLGNPAIAAEVKASDVHFQAYDSPDAPMLAQMGFKRGFYVQTRQGDVLHYSAEYPGREAIAQVLTGARRKADPNYDPAKDPDLTKPAPSPAPGPLAPDSPNVPLVYPPIEVILLIVICALLFVQIVRQPAPAPKRSA